MSDSPRISRVTTRTGDGGLTGLADGSRHRKDTPVINALGAVDELNAWFGVVLDGTAGSGFTARHHPQMEQRKRL